MPRGGGGGRKRPRKAAAAASAEALADSSADDELIVAPRLVRRKAAVKADKTRRDAASGGDGDSDAVGASASARKKRRASAAAESDAAPSDSRVDGDSGGDEGTSADDRHAAASTGRASLTATGEMRKKARKKPKNEADTWEAAAAAAIDARAHLPLNAADEAALSLIVRKPRFTGIFPLADEDPQLDGDDDAPDATEVEVAQIADMAYEKDLARDNADKREQLTNVFTVLLEKTGHDAIAGAVLGADEGDAHALIGQGGVAALGDLMQQVAEEEDESEEADVAASELNRIYPETMAKVRDALNLINAADERQTKRRFSTADFRYIKYARARAPGTTRKARDELLKYLKLCAKKRVADPCNLKGNWLMYEDYLRHEAHLTSRSARVRADGLCFSTRVTRLIRIYVAAKLFRLIEDTQTVADVFGKNTMTHFTSEAARFGQLVKRNEKDPFTIFELDWVASQLPKKRPADVERLALLYVCAVLGSRPSELLKENNTQYNGIRWKDVNFYRKRLQDGGDLLVAGLKIAKRKQSKDEGPVFIETDRLCQRADLAAYDPALLLLLHAANSGAFKEKSFARVISENKFEIDPLAADRNVFVKWDAKGLLLYDRPLMDRSFDTIWDRVCEIAGLPRRRYSSRSTRKGVALQMVMNIAMLDEFPDQKKIEQVLQTAFHWYSKTVAVYFVRGLPNQMDVVGLLTRRPEEERRQLVGAYRSPLCFDGRRYRSPTDADVLRWLKANVPGFRDGLSGAGGGRNKQSVSQRYFVDATHELNKISLDRAKVNDPEKPLPTPPNLHPCDLGKFARAYDESSPDRAALLYYAAARDAAAMPAAVPCPLLHDCGQTFTGARHMRDHLDPHAGVNKRGANTVKARCHVCDTTYETVDLWLMHLAYNHHQMTYCDDCEKRVTRSRTQACKKRDHQLTPISYFSQVPLLASFPAEHDWCQCCSEFRALGNLQIAVADRMRCVTGLPIVAKLADKEVARLSAMSRLGLTAADDGLSAKQTRAHARRLVRLAFFGTEQAMDPLPDCLVRAIFDQSHVKGEKYTGSQSQPLS